MIRTLSFAAAAGCLFALSSPARAQVNLVQNGTFAATTNGEGAYYTGTGAPPAGSTAAADWSACATTACNNADAGYPFLFVVTPGLANGTGAGTSSAAGFADPWDDAAGHGNNAQGTYYHSLWGSRNGGVGQNGGAAFNGYGPGGVTDPTNFLVSDADYHKTALSQSFTNLVAGDHYSVTFDWAAAQWWNNTGNTTEQWLVSLGGQTLGTQVYNLNSHAFSGWMSTTLNFTATSSNEALTFAATGGPGGEPPILLLDDVAMYDTPEPAAFGLMVVGLTCVAVAARRRRARAA